MLSSVRTFGRGRPSSSAVSVDSPLRSLGAGFASWAILLLPILDGYVSFLPGISAGLAFFLLGVVVLALTGFKWSGPYLPLMPVILYLLASPLLMLAFPIDSVHVYQPLSVALRWGKLLICLVPIFVFGGLGAMQLDSLLRRMRKIVYVAAVFIVVQRVAYAAGIVVPNPFVAFVSSDSYSLENYTMGAGALFRPSAFFLEPSHLTYYVIPFVICALFGAGKGGFPLCLRDGIVGAAAILCSGSGMGLLAVFSLFFLYSFMRSRKQVLFLGGVLLVAFALLLILNTSFFQGVVNRFLDPNAVGGNAIEARLGDGFLYFENKGFLAQLFGSGYGNVTTDTYYNGLAFVLCSLGIFGLLALIASVASSFRASAVMCQRLTAIAFAVFLLGGQVFTAPYLLLYFCIAGCAIGRREDDPDL